MDQRRGLGGQTRVEDPLSGRSLTLAELAGITGFYNWRGGTVVAPPVTGVLSMNRAGRLVPASVEAVERAGVQPLYVVATQSGRAITAAAHQAFRTALGFRPLADLAPGCEIALQWSGADIFWDRIAAIEDGDEGEAFLLTVAAHDNFAGDGFILKT